MHTAVNFGNIGGTIGPAVLLPKKTAASLSKLCAFWVPTPIVVFRSSFGGQESANSRRPSPARPEDRFLRRRRQNARLLRWTCRALRRRHLELIHAVVIRSTRIYYYAPKHHLHPTKTTPCSNKGLPDAKHQLLLLLLLLLLVKIRLSAHTKYHRHLRYYYRWRPDADRSTS